MSDDSPKASRATWIVPIVAASIAALGAVIAALVSSTPPSPDSHAISPPAAVAYQGTGTLRRADPEVDLDSSPNGTVGDNVGDLIHTPVALTTSKDSRIALLDRAQVPTLDVCRAALTATGTNTIRVSEIETGVQLCISTTAGRSGVITLDSVRKYSEAGPLRLGEVKFSYSIW